MLNTLFPLRAEDVTGAYIMAPDGRGRSSAMGTVVLEKVLDLMMLSMMFFYFSDKYHFGNGSIVRVIW